MVRNPWDDEDGMTGRGVIQVRLGSEDTMGCQAGVVIGEIWADCGPPRHETGSELDMGALNDAWNL
jgi:hypothetical protein